MKTVSLKCPHCDYIAKGAKERFAKAGLGRHMQSAHGIAGASKAAKAKRGSLKVKECMDPDGGDPAYAGLVQENRFLRKMLAEFLIAGVK